MNKTYKIFTPGFNKIVQAKTSKDAIRKFRQTHYSIVEGILLV